MDIEWVTKLMFFTNICVHLNELNFKLQGLNKTIIITIDLIKCFEAKLAVFKSEVQSDVFKIFSENKEIF